MSNKNWLTSFKLGSTRILYYCIPCLRFRQAMSFYALLVFLHPAQYPDFVFCAWLAYEIFRPTPPNLYQNQSFGSSTPRHLAYSARSEVLLHLTPFLVRSLSNRPIIFTGTLWSSYSEEPRNGTPHCSWYSR